MQPTALRIGDILVNQGAIARDDLEHHAAHARGRLGEYLHTHGQIDGRALSRALATQHGLAYAEFDHQPPDRSLFSPRDLAHYIAHRYVPFIRAGGVLSIATTQPSASLRDIAANHHHCPVKLVVTSPRDLAQYFATVGAQATTRRARLTLRRQHRGLVADRILHPNQMRGLGLMLLALTASFAFIPFSWEALIIGCNLFYLGSLALKLQLYWQGLAAKCAYRALDIKLRHDITLLQADDLPIYTILIPLYRESDRVIARLIAHLNALDYPKEKLDIKLICEADDAHTIAILKILRPPQTMEILRVPPSHPRTKPKACNVALQHIRGEFLVIFDAEDAPAPDQLKRAVALFHDSPDHLACLQAPLNYDNRDENLLTQLFAIEYSALFRLMLPALERMQLPIPLGGTSNHLRVAALTAAGGWDAFNVTEDADLGIRLAYLGYSTRMLPSLTLEEAPIRLNAWLKQRTRWIKGYIQTWLVYTRDTAQSRKSLGNAGYYGFQFFVGAPALTFLLSPIFWGVFLVSMTGYFPVRLSPAMASLCWFSLVSGIVTNWFFARSVLKIEGWHHMGMAMLTYPFYWILHSLAAARALWQLITAPHYWDKTTHGVSNHYKKRFTATESAAN